MKSSLLSNEQLIEDITQRNPEAWIGTSGEGGTASEHIVWWLDEGFITQEQADFLTRHYQDEIQETIDSLTS